MPINLLQGLNTARSLDEVVTLHKRFVLELDQQCGRGGVAGGTQKHVWAAVIRVLVSRLAGMDILNQGFAVPYKLT